MRISLVVLFCAIGFAATGALADDKSDPENEALKFQGTWTFASSEAGGQAMPADMLKGLVLTFEGDKDTVKMGDDLIQIGTQKLDPTKSPNEVLTV